MSRSNIGLIVGPLLFILLLFLPQPEGLSEQGMAVAGVAVLMAIWWITEAIPIPATALIPIVLYPLLDVMAPAEVTQSYAHHLIFLFMGGFMIAVTVEKWNLHQRIALHTIRIVGMTPDRIILGFMIATAFLSMWISNTAATMMMITVGLAVLHQIAKEIEADDSTQNIDTREGHFRFGIALMLGIGYSASIGGVSTLIGTAPNLVFAGIVEDMYGISINFLEWMLFGLPLAIVMLAITWFYLTRIAYPSEMDHLPGGEKTIRKEILSLGKITSQEKKVLTVFCLVAALWIARGLFNLEIFHLIKDSTIAMAGALLLFVIPSNWQQREFLLDWKTAVKIPWDILILFGGGFALAKGFSETGLTTFLASQLSILDGSHIIMIIAIVTLLVVFLTELTSNTATASLTLPIMAALAGAMQIHPFGLMVATVIAASFAFMLPVATPPNAIVFSSRYVTIPQMMKAGIWLNLLGAALITTFVMFLLPIAWGIDINIFPEDISFR
ncbi:MAG: sodium-dependent dicarboxylate transporter 2/3/5 [Gammaproteobacteria bacterium]|jgi:sodium-dependent dicarboxylate transporter 2/3/5